MSTVFPTKQGIERNWHVVDANDVVLGKLASHAARLLMGKHKTTWTPFIDTGDHVVVINAEKVKLTGKKDTQKLYRHFTGYPGGLVETGAAKVRASRPSSSWRLDPIRAEKSPVPKRRSAFSMDRSGEVR